MGSSGVQVLILNGLVVTLVVLSFLVLRRAPKPPVKLDLRSNGGKVPTPNDFLRAVQDIDDKTPVAQIQSKPKFSDPRKPAGQQKPVGWDNYTPRKRSVYGGPATQEKSLNIFFNWNGHSWDAYEVLGVPAGASLDMVYKAFERAKAQADRETLPFLSAAYEAVVNTYTLR
jgi:hypothetical protein